MKGAFKAIGETGPGTTGFRRGVNNSLPGATGIPREYGFCPTTNLMNKFIKIEGVNKEIMADKGVATNGDETRHEKASNSLQGTPKYNEYILDMKRALLERDKDKHFL